MSDLKPISPAEAKEQYLEAIRTEKAKSTVRTREYQLCHLVRWYGEENIENMNYPRWPRLDELPQLAAGGWGPE